MVWYKLKIGNYEARYTPIKAEVKDFPYCDKDGNLLTKVIPPKTQSQKTFFIVALLVIFVIHLTWITCPSGQFMIMKAPNIP